MWKSSLTPGRILFGDRLWNGLLASKLQFDAQKTTGYVFQLKAAPQDCVCTVVGGCFKWWWITHVFFFLGEDKALAQLGQEKYVDGFNTPVCLLLANPAEILIGSIIFFKQPAPGICD